jgi:hypothetical protein
LLHLGQAVSGDEGGHGLGISRSSLAESLGRLQPETSERQHAGLGRSHCLGGELFRGEVKIRQPDDLATGVVAGTGSYNHAAHHNTAV